MEQKELEAFVDKKAQELLDQATVCGESGVQDVAKEQLRAISTAKAVQDKGLQ